MKHDHAAWLTRALAAAALAFAVSAGAGTPVAAHDARIPAPLPGQRVAAAYLTITSPVPARVLAAESDAARSVQFHAMSMDGDIMRMRRLHALELPAGRAVKLAPGGVHLMLVGLARPLRAGDAVPIRFTVGAADGTRRIVPLTIPVVQRGDSGGGHD